MPFEALIIEPPAAEWPVDLVGVMHDTIGSLRQQARKRLVDSAEQFVLRLSALASAAGLPLQDRPLLTGDSATTPIVMTGHQPVIFHSGLTFKYQTTEEFARKHRLIAVAVVIDTDEGDAGTFSYPSIDTSQGQSEKDSLPDVPRLVTRTATLARKPGLFSASRLKARDELAAEFAAIENTLRKCGKDQSATAFLQVAHQYAALAESTTAGVSTMEANLITRWNADIGGRMLELPLSAICSFPEFIRFTSQILERPFEFAQCYNTTLNSFRSEHRIRNEANPFPNLTIEDDCCELPYWVIDHTAGTRDVLRVRRVSGSIWLECNHELLMTVEKFNVAEALTSLLFSSKQLVPRGALITATLRLLFSDLFIHGTGGGKYDPCTDALIRNWWSVEPTPFAVASASCFLFSDGRRNLLHLQRIESQLRDMQYNPQRFLGTDTLPVSLEADLKTLLHRKESAVARMKSARESGQSAADIGREIQQLTDSIKTTVSLEFEPQLAELRSLTEENIATISSRTWPWFLFSSLVILFCCFAKDGTVRADDWPQWNGPTRDGVVHEAGILTTIPDGGLTRLWREDIQLGYSGPAISKGLVYIFDYAKTSGSIINKAGKRDELTGRERLLCLDAVSGKLLWKDEHEQAYAVSYGGGPRTTPTIHNGLVYTLGAEGNLRCLDARTGQPRWARDFKAEFKAETPQWGHAASPLVYGDFLICMVGGEGSLVVAFDLQTGAEQWRSLSSKETGYCPPSVITYGGIDQLLIWSPEFLNSLDPESGQLNWQVELKPQYGMSILPPISEGDLLYAGGEGSIGVMLRLKDGASSPEVAWRGEPKTGVYVATSTAIFDNGYIYGADIRSGALVCARASDGERKWQSAVPTTGSTRGRGDGHGTAFLLKCDNDYLIFSETGDFISAKLTPEGYSETGRFHAIDPTGTTMGRDYVWTFPAIADGRLYLRNDREVICYDISMQVKSSPVKASDSK